MLDFMGVKSKETQNDAMVSEIHFPNLFLLVSAVSMLGGVDMKQKLPQKNDYKVKQKNNIP